MVFPGPQHPQAKLDQDKLSGRPRRIGTSEGAGDWDGVTMRKIKFHLILKIVKSNGQIRIPQGTTTGSRFQRMSIT